MGGLITLARSNQARPFLSALSRLLHVEHIEPIGHSLLKVTDRSLRSLYSSSDGVRGLCAAVKNLSHRASRNVASAWLIPRHSGTAHLGLNEVLSVAAKL